MLIMYLTCLAQFFDDMKIAMILFCSFITTTTINNVALSHQSGFGSRISMLNGYRICITEILSTLVVGMLIWWSTRSMPSIDFSRSSIFQRIYRICFIIPWDLDLVSQIFKLVHLQLNTAFLYMINRRFLLHHVSCD